ncbi:transient receptor potential cation channel subfamily M member 2-like [Ptychodera flava]|uniref:transient receptor potential cation channel subfamily M member 2-like n=1 Tax=Ptychodera flava TaxID=63121 RepID=UPI00396A3910
MEGGSRSKTLILVLKLTNRECGQLIEEKVDPDKQLFLWAVLLNRRALAILFWKRLTTCNIGAALVASRILRALAVYLEETNTGCLFRGDELLQTRI